MKKSHNIETIRGRFLIGREGGAMQWVSTYEDLDRALARVVKAQERDDDGESLWAFHVFMIRHCGGWIEQIVFINPDNRGVDEKVYDICREEIAMTMERMRDGNRYVPPLASRLDPVDDSSVPLPLVG